MKNSRKGTKSKNQVATVSQVRALIRGNVERKVLSNNAATTTISSSGTVINLSNNIIEGPDVFNRTGTMIRFTKQEIRFRFSAVTTNQSCRWLIVRDMHNQGSTPAVVDVLPTGTYQSHYSDVRTIQARRFSVLHDEIIDTSINGEAVKSSFVTISKKGTIYYNGSTAVAASNGSGAIFLIVVGSSSTGQFDYDWQITFTDS